MKTYTLCLDDIMEDLFLKMEKISEGSSSHKVEIKTISNLKASEILSRKLVPFFMERFEE